MGIIKNNFHDSNIKNITISENILQIRIDIDTHWSPGKKHGLLRLTNPQYDERFIEYWENDTDGWVESIKCERLGDRFLIKIVFHSRPEKIWDIIIDKYGFSRR